MRIKAILAASLALLMAACTSTKLSSTETPSTFVLEASTPANRYTTEKKPENIIGASPQGPQAPSNLYLILDDGGVPLENGDSHRLADELNVQITVDPYPPTGLSAHVVLDIYLTNELGDPISDADITVQYDMFTMVHGPFESTMINRGGGHYLVSLDLLMFGAWGIETTIRTPLRAEPYQLKNAVIVSLPPQ